MGNPELSKRQRPDLWGQKVEETMAPVRGLFEKFRDSHGRTKAVTAGGVLLLAAAVALVVGVLPALAASVPGVQVNWGGGSGACDNALIALMGEDAGTAR